MPTKEQILYLIQTLASQRAITKDEILNAYNAGAGLHGDAGVEHKNALGVSEVLSIIGAGIVFLGVVVLLGQNWTTLSFATKILATFGIGFSALASGVLLNRKPKMAFFSAPLYIMSVLVLPIGLGVVFDKAGFDFATSQTQSELAGILLVMYFLLYVFLRENIFLLFALLFGTSLYFNITNLMIGGSPYFGVEKFYEYRVLLIGLSYILLGYSFANSKREPLRGILYGFGILAFLGSIFALSGFQPTQNIFWEVALPFLIFGTLLLGPQFKSKAFLTFGTIALMAYIAKITGEYFTSGLGWPLALMLGGMLMIGAGYLSLNLKKRYK